MKIKVQALSTGKVKPLGNEFLTGIRKSTVEELVVHKDRVDGDEVRNLKYHGGDLRVLHHYSEAHYKHFKEKFPEIADRFIPGSFGENIYTNELTESDLCVGDVFRLGTTRIQVTASRRPCATINLSYEDPRILKEVVQSHRTGWFYRIVDAGIVHVGDYLELIERPYPELKLDRLFTEGYFQKSERDFGFLRSCLETGLMEKGWKPAIEKLLEGI